MDTSNETTKDQRFCINPKINEGWVISIALNFEEGILTIHNAVLDFDNLPFLDGMFAKAGNMEYVVAMSPRRYQPKLPRRPTYVHYGFKNNKGKGLALGVRKYQ